MNQKARNTKNIKLEPEKCQWR